MAEHRFVTFDIPLDALDTSSPEPGQQRIRFGNLAQLAGGAGEFLAQGEIVSTHLLQTKTDSITVLAFVRLPDRTPPEDASSLALCARRPGCGSPGPSASNRPP